MTEDEIVAFTVALGDVVAQRPTADDPQVPEIAWGDTFFYYSPSGEIPARTQPFATIVTKRYPGEPDSHLDAPGAFRVNAAVGTDDYTRRIGSTPRATTPATAPAPLDVVVPHPTYAGAGWVSVSNPTTTAAALRELLAVAHQRARARAAR